MAFDIPDPSDMVIPDPSDMVPFAELWFQAVNADVEIIPVMSRDDVKKGSPSSADEQVAPDATAGCTPRSPDLVLARNLRPDGLPRWPLFGRPSTLNAAAYCAPISTVSAAERRNGRSRIRATQSTDQMLLAHSLDLAEERSHLP